MIGPHKYVNHTTYAGPGCAMCGKDEASHEEPKSLDQPTAIPEVVESAASCQCGRVLMIAATPDENGDARWVCEKCWKPMLNCDCSALSKDVKRQPSGGPTGEGPCGCGNPTWRADCDLCSNCSGFLPEWSWSKASQDEVTELREECSKLLALLGSCKVVMMHVEHHASGYDWNDDPLSLTLKIGDIYRRIDAALASSAKPKGDGE